MLLLIFGFDPTISLVLAFDLVIGPSGLISLILLDLVFGPSGLIDSLDKVFAKLSVEVLVLSLCPNASFVWIICTA